jgi:uncharacterized LabA/DUF88 family protein
MYFKDTERLALFVDGANLYATAKALGFDIDYKRLLNLFRTKARVSHAFYYTAYPENSEYSKIHSLVDWLDYNGYTTVAKPSKEKSDIFGRRRVRGRIDIDLAVDVLRLAPGVDHVVLFTGDGDLRALVDAVQAMGRRVSVVSSVLTEPAMLDDGLRRQADQFIDLHDLEAEIVSPRKVVRRRRLVEDTRARPRPFRFA